jgi:tetratricopeptide (TPR) repeat protein
MSAKSTGLRVLALLACFLITAPVVAQELIPGTTVATKRTQALNLSDRGRHPEALPMLEELTQVLPNDALVWERYAMALLSTAATLPDIEARKLMRVRAKQAFTRTRELGNNTPLAMLGNAIPPDGGEPPLASSAEAQSAMQTAEAAFARGDFAQAITHYQKTLDVEPTHYNATVFIGDCYYRMKDVERAGEWFARAIALSPNTETAHRYWGDALLRSGKPEEARSRFIDAFIAEPYNGAARTGLTQWGQVTGARFGRPVITPQVNAAKTNDGASITFDPSTLKEGAANTMGAAWAVYSMRRAMWVGEEFRKRYPNEPAYRHSLAEEIDAFNQLLAFADEQEKKGQPITDPQISTIRGLREKGMLEPYVLLHAPDAGIAQDYDRYRVQNRDKLQAYVESMIVYPRRQP